MGPKAIQWRSVKKSAWHLFIGQKSICNRGYSNGEFDASDTVPPKDSNICRFCVRIIPVFRDRITSITEFVKP